MRTIMVLNAKGGCGKSTIATNLASYFASQLGQNVVLADYDPQESSMAWLEARDESRPLITGIAAHRDPLRPPKDTDVVIMDTPARVHGKELTQLLRKVETILDTFRSQRSHQWFSADTFWATLRLRGVECNAPHRFAEGFRCRKLVL